jgi:drug efflux transport system permease protein
MTRLRIRSLITKEFRQLRRDRRSLGFFLVVPLMQLFLFGYAVSTDLRNVNLAVAIHDPSASARELVTAVLETHAFTLTQQSDDSSRLRGWLDDGTAQIALDIPPQFDQMVARGQAPEVQVLVDGSDSNTATLAVQYLQGAALAWASRYQAERRIRHPEAMLRFRQVPRIDLEPRVWYNPDLKSTNYQIPGVLALIVLVICTSQTALAVVREREIGTLEQLSVTPLRSVELLIGKTVPLALLGMGFTVAIILAARFWFLVPLRGSVPFLLVAALIYLLNTLGLGLLISVVSTTQIQAQLTTSFLLTPLILLSGFLFPISAMPAWARAFTYLLPTRYYLEIVRGVFLKGQGAAELWPQAFFLLMLGSAFYGAGMLLFRKRAS